MNMYPHSYGNFVRPPKYERLQGVPGLCSRKDRCGEVYYCFSGSCISGCRLFRGCIIRCDLAVITGRSSSFSEAARRQCERHRLRRGSDVATGCYHQGGLGMKFEDRAANFIERETRPTLKSRMRCRTVIRPRTRTQRAAHFVGGCERA